MKTEKLPRKLLSMIFPISIVKKCDVDGGQASGYRKWALLVNKKKIEIQDSLNNAGEYINWFLQKIG